MKLLRVSLKVDHVLGILIQADYVFQVNLKCTVNQISMDVLVSNLFDGTV